MRRRGCLHSLMIWAAVGLIAAGFWQYQNNILAAEPFSVASDRLPTAFDGLRIVVVSDLHGKTFGPGNETLLDAVEAAEPDLIAITGDLADETCLPERVTAMVDTAASLDTIAPAYYISGNHEWVMDGTWDFYQRLEQGELPPNIAELFDQFVARKDLLTEAERNILRYYIDGYEIAEIPELAFISMSTVRKHNRSIYEKLGVASRDELMLYIDLLRRCGRLQELF